MNRNGHDLINILQHPVEMVLSNTNNETIIPILASLQFANKHSIVVTHGGLLTSMNWPTLYIIIDDRYHWLVDYMFADYNFNR